MATLSINGSTIHYREMGSGKPVMLVHGFPLDGRVWAGQIDALAEKYRVIAPDLHGFGQSKAHRASSMESMVQDLRTLVSSLDAEKLAVAGLSMGGYIAQHWIKTCPTDIAALILVDTKASADNTEAMAGRDRMIELAGSSGTKAVADAMLPKMLAAKTLSRQCDIAGRLSEIMESQSPQAVQWALAAMRDRDDFSEELAAIAVPVLLVFGEHDAITPPTLAEGMKSAIPRAQLEVIREAGHMSPLEKPAEVATAIRKFLDQCY